MSDQENATEDAVVVSPTQPADASPTASAAPNAKDPFGLVIDVPLRLTVELGSSRMLLREVLQLGKGAVVDLDRGASDPVDILINGRLIARGDLTTSDDRLAVRIVEMVQSDGSSDSRQGS